MRVSESTYKAMPLELQALFRKCPNPGSAEVLSLFPVTKSCKPYTRQTDGAKMYEGGWDKWTPAENNYGDSGSAARFFKCCPITDNDRRLVYCAKASRAERDAGLDGLQQVKLRNDLEPEQREWVMAELERCGVRL